MSERKLLKKYGEEILQNETGKSLLSNIGHDFAFNTKDKEHISKTIAKQFLTIIRDTIKTNSKANANVFPVDTSKDFKERILNHLPFYMRKEPLLIEIAIAISKELQRLELKKKQMINGLSLSTNIDLLDRIESVYGIKTNYSLGIKFRQNKLIARELTKYEVFNIPYILKISELFEIGKILNITNDKIHKILTITLESNIKNIKGINEYICHLKEFSPAFYTITITN